MLECRLYNVLMEDKSCAFHIRLCVCDTSAVACRTCFPCYTPVDVADVLIGLNASAIRYRRNTHSSGCDPLLRPIARAGGYNTKLGQFEGSACVPL